MLYSVKEEYFFHFPQEYNYYLEFKQNLQDLGIAFVETSDASRAATTIQIHNSAIFNDGELVSQIKKEV